MNNTQLLLTGSFVIVAMLLSRWRDLALEKDILWSTIRAGAQLLIIGYILHFIFSANHWTFTLLIILVMTSVAANNVARKAKTQRLKVFLYVAIALFSSWAVAITLLLGLHIIQATPQYLIPISGMLIGNAMVVGSLQWNRIQAEMNNRRHEVEVLLSLGFSSEKASAALVKKTVQASMIPTIDSMKTMGLVQLPGMMTGQIIAGANPITAVKYQILIVFTMTATAAICSIILGFLMYRLFFNQHHQLR
ncbi:MAG: ABC transporter permease [Tumebacillaceae bacterium]